MNLYFKKHQFYKRARSGYPSKLVEQLRELLLESSVNPVLDVGSGTGIFSRQLSLAGCTVLGIDPDPEMVCIANNTSREFLNLSFVCGSAESLPIGDNSASSIICAQSFHWFDPVKSKAEFRRVLCSGGKVFLIWNIRSKDSDEMHISYESLLIKLFPNYTHVLNVDSHLDATVQTFFSPNTPQESIFYFRERLSRAKFIARNLSYSFAHVRGSDGFLSAKLELENFFFKYNVKGFLEFNYQARLLCGVLDENSRANYG